MKKLTDTTKQTFFQLLNGGVSVKDFEHWVYENSDNLELELNSDFHLALISFNFNQNSTICRGDSITLSLSGFTIATPYVSWNGGVLIPNNNSITIAPTQDTIVNVAVNVQPPTTCAAVTNSLYIHVNQPPIVTLTTLPPTDTICQGTALNFAALPTGFDTYTFYNGQSL